MKIRITTTMNVNVRSGPGMVYDKVEQVRAGTTFTATDTSKDKNKILWYKVDKGWICGTYVTLDKSRQAADMTRAYKLKSATGEIPPPAGEGETQKLPTNADYGGTKNPNSSIGEVEDRVEGADSTDILLGKRIFGIPYQYLDTTDIRLGNDSNKNTSYDRELGLNFAEMMSELPILSVIPGVPMFMPDLSEAEKSTMLNILADKAQGIAERMTDNALESIAGDSAFGKDLRYFSFQEDFTTFVRYFNTLCQMNAVMMGLGNEYVPGAPNNNDDYKFAFFDWTKYTLSISMAGRISDKAKQLGATENKQTVQEEIFGYSRAAKERFDQLVSSDKNVASATLDYYDTAVEPYYTDFVVRPGINYSETFGNDKKDSIIAGMFNQASDTMKELQFILNTSRAVSEETVKESKEAALGALKQGAEALGNNTFVNRFLKGASSILSGANIVFPELWSSSNYSRSFSIEIPLYTPYGSLTNIFMDILVPIWFWIAISAPRQASANSYSAPFLLKCHVPGIFSVDMGMVESLTINKGVDNEWSVDGYPLAVTLSVQIVDLYSSFYISRINGISPTDAYNFLQNNGLIDYVAVQSGIDMKRGEFGKKLAVAEALGRTAFSDFFTHPLASNQETVASAVRDIGTAGKLIVAAATRASDRYISFNTNGGEDSGNEG